MEKRDLAELKAEVEQLGLVVKGTGKSGRKLRVDYEAALEKHHKGKKKATPRKTSEKKREKIDDPSGGKAELWILFDRHDGSNHYFKKYEDVVRYIDVFLDDPEIESFGDYNKAETKKRLYAGTDYEYFPQGPDERHDFYLSYSNFE